MWTGLQERLRAVPALGAGAGGAGRMKLTVQMEGEGGYVVEKEMNSPQSPAWNSREVSPVPQPDLPISHNLLAMLLPQGPRRLQPSWQSQVSPGLI